MTSTSMPYPLSTTSEALQHLTCNVLQPCASKLQIRPSPILPFGRAPSPAVVPTRHQLALHNTGGYTLYLALLRKLLEMKDEPSSSGGPEGVGDGRAVDGGAEARVERKTEAQQSEE